MACSCFPVWALLKLAVWSIESFSRSFRYLLFLWGLGLLNDAFGGGKLKAIYLGSRQDCQNLEVYVKEKTRTTSGCSLISIFKGQGLEDISPLGWSCYQKSNTVNSQQIFETPFMKLGMYNLDVQLVSCTKASAAVNRIAELYVSLLNVIRSVSS